MPRRSKSSPKFVLGFFCTADWRWISAQALASEPRRRAVADPWVRRVENYLRGRPDKAIAAATEIRNAPESGSPGIRTLLDSYLLAETDVALVANRISLPLDVVEAYARIFFDVFPKLKATDWTSLRVMRGGVAASFGGDLAACVRYAGYSGGAAVAAVVWAVLADQPVPAWVPDRKQYDCPLAREKVRITVALMTATTPEQSAEAVRRMPALRRSKSTGERVANNKGTSSMLDLYEQVLASTVRPKSASLPAESILPAVSHNGSVVQAPAPRGKITKGLEKDQSHGVENTETNRRVVPAPKMARAQTANTKGKSRANSDPLRDQAVCHVVGKAVDQNADATAPGPNSSDKLLDHVVGGKSPRKTRATEAERVRISAVS